VTGDADGNTTNDIVIAADCKSVQLRSERNETLNGRVYVITLRVHDAAGLQGKRANWTERCSGGAGRDGADADERLSVNPKYQARPRSLMPAASVHDSPNLRSVNRCGG
jgi:hypothetical protein